MLSLAGEDQREFGRLVGLGSHRYLTLMTQEDVLNEFRGADALREGHFVLSSGLHSPVFLQKNLVFA